MAPVNLGQVGNAAGGLAKQVGRAGKSSLIAAGGGDAGQLTKAKLVVTVGGQIRKELQCQFNPTQFTITKEVLWYSDAQGRGSDQVGTWEEAVFFSGDSEIIYGSNEKTPDDQKNTPDLEFGGGLPATFGLELFFDTSDQEDVDRDVRRYIHDLLALALAEKQENPASNSANEMRFPPLVQFVWGKISLFEAVMETISVTYLLFDPDGTPLRAKVRAGFVQFDYYRDDNRWKWQNPTTRTAPKKTWVVRQGQSLHQIAQVEYGHPSYWRHIADSNRLHNPLDLRPGQVLILPAVQP